MKLGTLDKLAHQDFNRISKRIERFISSYVSKSSAKGLIIGLSGGLDSSVVVKLAVNALSPSRVLGIIMPSEATPIKDVEHAIELATSLGIQYKVIDINSLLGDYSRLLPEDKKARGNLMARIRMNILYYYANINGYLVAGTSDKSELYIGYFTKFGDGAADILPIADLYKTQVRVLAKYLSVPGSIIEKKSSPRLWLNHLAEEEIGVTYETIDPILYLLVDRKLKPKDAAIKLGIPANQVDKVRKMMEANMHKRNMPAIAWQKS
jgi:NAD+ synthase